MHHTCSLIRFGNLFSNGIEETSYTHTHTHKILHFVCPTMLSLDCCLFCCYSTQNLSHLNSQKYELCHRLSRTMPIPISIPMRIHFCVVSFYQCLLGFDEGYLFVCRLELSQQYMLCAHSHMIWQ